MLHRRRRFLVAGAGILAAPALLAQAARPRVAWVSGSQRRASPFLVAFTRSMQELGYEHGRNVEIESHFTDGSAAGNEAKMREVLATRPSVVVVQGTAVKAAHALNPQVPVVFGFSGDPVEAGFAQSLARPGGNMTGVTFLALDLVGKRIQALHQLVPRLRRVAVLANPLHAGEKSERQASEAAARSLGMEVVYLPATKPEDIEPALAAARRARCDGVDVYPDALMASAAERIAALCEREKLASVSGWSVFPDSGLLMSYGPNLVDAFARIAAFADRILRGARPGEIPVEQPSTVEMVVNLRTARALGIAVPQQVLLRANRTID